MLTESQEPMGRCQITIHLTELRLTHYDASVCGPRGQLWRRSEDGYQGAAFASPGYWEVGKPRTERATGAGHADSIVSPPSAAVVVGRVSS